MLEYITFSHLNINSSRNKFNNLEQYLNSGMKMFVVGEPKIYQSFPIKRFSTESSHEPFRHDVTDRGGGIVVYG